MQQPSEETPKSPRSGADRLCGPPVPVNRHDGSRQMQLKLPLLWVRSTRWLGGGGGVGVRAPFEVGVVDAYAKGLL